MVDDRVYYIASAGLFAYALDELGSAAITPILLDTGHCPDTVAELLRATAGAGQPADGSGDRAAHPVARRAAHPAGNPATYPAGITRRA